MEQLLDNFSLGSLIMQAIILIILILLLRKFAWKGILKSLENREERIKNALLAAEKAEQKTKSILSKNKEDLRKAAIEHDKILKRAGQLKDKIIADAKIQATEQANVLMKKTFKSIELQKQEALKDVRLHIGKISLEMAKKILQKELSSEKEHLDYVDKLLEKKY